MSAQGSHAGSAADVDHFLLGRFDVEVAEGADGCDFVASLQIKCITGANAWKAVLARRWGGDTHVEFELPFGHTVAR